MNIKELFYKPAEIEISDPYKDVILQECKIDVTLDFGYDEKIAVPITMSDEFYDLYLEDPSLKKIIEDTISYKRLKKIAELINKARAEEVV